MDNFNVVETLDFLLNEYHKFIEICDHLFNKKFQLTQFKHQSRHQLSDDKWFYIIQVMCEHEVNQHKTKLIQAIKSFMAAVSGQLTRCFKDETYNYDIQNYDIDDINFTSLKIFDGFICEGKSDIIFAQTRMTREFEGSFYFRKKLLPNARGWTFLPVEYYKIYILYDILCSIHCYGKEGKIFYLYFLYFLLLCLSL